MIKLSSKCSQIILEPLSQSDINSKKFHRCVKEINLADLYKDVCDREMRKGYIDLLIIRMIVNGKNNQNQQVRHYKSKDSKKLAQLDLSVYFYHELVEVMLQYQIWFIFLKIT